jgi:hypothetical protein
LLLLLQSLAVLGSLSTLLQQQFDYTEGSHFMCICGSVSPKNRWDMIKTFNSEPGCKVRRHQDRHWLQHMPYT